MTDDYRNPTRANIERRLGLEPIHVILAQRAALVTEVADLRAKFGSFGTFDAERKTKLATIKMRIRAQMTASGVKVTESAMDDEAHADPDYIAYITEATRSRAKLQVLEDQIQALNDMLQRDKTLAHFSAQEMRLT